MPTRDYYINYQTLDFTDPTSCPHCKHPLLAHQRDGCTREDGYHGLGSVCQCPLSQLDIMVLTNSHRIDKLTKSVESLSRTVLELTRLVCKEDV